MPWHFGWEGYATGDIANVLTAIVGDPNTTIHEGKAFTCNLRKRTRNRDADAIERLAPMGTVATHHGRNVNRCPSPSHPLPSTARALEYPTRSAGADRERVGADGRGDD